MPVAWRLAVVVAVIVLVGAPSGFLESASQGHTALGGAHVAGEPRASSASRDPSGDATRRETPTKPRVEPGSRDLGRAPHLSATVPSHGPSTAMLFPPNPDPPRVAPGEAAATSPYASAPAPMGLSDLGVGSGGTYEYGASSFEGTLTLSSFSAFSPTNDTGTGFPSPDWVLVQLDAVAVNVTLPPATSTASNGTFWVQNGLHFNGSSLELEDNIWNFSNRTPDFPTSTILSGKGAVLDDQVYVGFGPNLSAFPVAYPLTIVLFDNITTTVSGTGLHTVVSVGYSFSDPRSTIGGTYDTVTFGGSPSTSSPSQFRVDGAKLNPYGSLYDAELDLGGNGNGANANVVELNGSATLLYSTGSGYQSVPSAFDFGADSSETALGVAVAYTGTTARLTAGPSFLNGLWNTNGPNASRIAPYAPPGWIEVRITVSPTYAVLFGTNHTLAEMGSLAEADYQYAPTNRTGALTTDLPKPVSTDPYVFEAWADGFAAAEYNISDNSTNTTPANLDLVPSPSTVDAPVYLLGTSQADAFGRADVVGTGYSASAGEIWLNASTDNLAAPFLRLNEFGYPTFPLMAAAEVNLSVDVNGFVQDPRSFDYTEDTGGELTLANYTQGYFFYYGSGHFEVQNTTVEGNATLAHGPPRTFPPSTIEFYHESDPAVRNVSVAYDAVGLTLIDSSSATVTNLLVGTGAVGILAEHDTDVTVIDASASGHDPYGISSVLAYFLASSTVSLSDLSVAGASLGPALGVWSQSSTHLDISHLTVSSGAQGIAVNATSPGVVTNLSVTGGVAGAGSWTNGSDLSFTTVSVNGSGLFLSDDEQVSVVDGSTSGYGSAVVSNFSGSSGGTFRSIDANGGSNGLILNACSSVNVTEVDATNGSVGAFLTGVKSATGDGFTSASLSLGLLVNDTAGGVFSAFSATDQSTGAFVNNSSGITLERVTVTNATLDPFGYFTNASGAQSFPIAGVGLAFDTSVNVTNVSATDYPFAVISNNSVHVNVSLVTDLYGNESVAFNSTNTSRITEVFALGDLLGISLQSCDGATVADSTLELSGGVGLDANNSRITVEDNNFIANNGSSVDGKFSLENLQAWANGTTGSAGLPAFKDNYWPDRSGSAYVINSSSPSVKDASPLSAFYSNYLEFTENGLPAGATWVVDALGNAYASNVSLLYIPGWDIGSSDIPFTVPSAIVTLSNNATREYPPHPANGTLAWKATDSSVTESITFGTPSSPAGPALPLWLIAGIGVAVVVAVVVAFAVMRRRSGGRRYRAPDPRDENPFS